MNILKLSPVLLSALLLAAHFFRSGFYFLVAFCLLFPFLLLIKAKGIVRIVQVILIIGALEWFRTLYSIAAERIVNNQPWARLVIILLAVSLFTACSSFVFNFRSLKIRYKFKN